MTQQPSKRRTSPATNYGLSRRRFFGNSLVTGAGAMALCQTNCSVLQAGGPGERRSAPFAITAKGEKQT